jgi:hypothetical protein
MTIERNVNKGGRESLLKCRDRLLRTLAAVGIAAAAVLGSPGTAIANEENSDTGTTIGIGDDSGIPTDGQDYDDTGDVPEIEESPVVPGDDTGNGDGGKDEESPGGGINNEEGEKPGEPTPTETPTPTPTEPPTEPPATSPRPSGSHIDQDVSPTDFNPGIAPFAGGAAILTTAAFAAWFRKILTRGK